MRNLPSLSKPSTSPPAPVMATVFLAAVAAVLAFAMFVSPGVRNAEASPGMISGVALDACGSNTPLSGADATLLIETFDGSGEFVPAHLVMAVSGLNPQTTAADGAYDWMVFPDHIISDLKIQVTKAGYAPVFSQEFAIVSAQILTINLALQCDSDADGQSDDDELACGSDPLDNSSLSPDNEGDGVPDCVDTDDDNDLTGDAEEVACGSDPLDAAWIPERIDGAYSGVDDDGDTQVDEPLPSPGSESFDCDGDGFTGTTEMHVFQRGSNIDDQYGCPETITPGDEPDDRWPADFDDNQWVTIIDVLDFKAPFHGSVASGNERYDLSPGGGPTINIIDILAMKPWFGHTCA